MLNYSYCSHPDLYQDNQEDHKCPQSVIFLGGESKWTFYTVIQHMLHFWNPQDKIAWVRVISVMLTYIKMIRKRSVL